MNIIYKKMYSNLELRNQKVVIYAKVYQMETKYVIVHEPSHVKGYMQYVCLCVNLMCRST